jgi:hypothetical protein
MCYSEFVIVISRRIMVRLLYQGDIFADYFQLYLRDEAHSELPNDYTEESIARRLMVGPNGIILYTVRNMSVAVCVEWHDPRPTPNLDTFQHVVDAGFSCPTGQLVLAGMTDDESTSPRLNVKSGLLGVRVCYSGLETLSEDGLDGEDQYLVQLWPEENPLALHVLKAWQAT